MASHGVLSCCRQFPHVAFLDAQLNPGLTDARTSGSQRGVACSGSNPPS
jgi:hypothetical protein